MRPGASNVLEHSWDEYARSEVGFVKVERPLQSGAYFRFLPPSRRRRDRLQSASRAVQPALARRIQGELASAREAVHPSGMSASSTRVLSRPTNCAKATSIACDISAAPPVRSPNDCRRRTDTPLGALLRKIEATGVPWRRPKPFSLPRSRSLSHVCLNTDQSAA